MLAKLHTKVNLRLSGRGVLPHEGVMGNEDVSTTCASALVGCQMVEQGEEHIFKSVNTEHTLLQYEKVTFWSFLSDLLQRFKIFTLVRMLALYEPIILRLDNVGLRLHDRLRVLGVLWWGLRRLGDLDLFNDFVLCNTEESIKSGAHHWSREQSPHTTRQLEPCRRLCANLS